MRLSCGDEPSQPTPATANIATSHRTPTRKPVLDFSTENGSRGEISQRITVPEFSSDLGSCDFNRHADATPPTIGSNPTSVTKPREPPSVTAVTSRQVVCGGQVPDSRRSGRQVSDSGSASSRVGGWEDVERSVSLPSTWRLMTRRARAHWSVRRLRNAHQMRCAVVPAAGRARHEPSGSVLRAVAARTSDDVFAGRGASQPSDRPTAGAAGS